MTIPALNPAPMRGVLLIAAAVFLFACMDTTSKYLSATYAVPLVVAARYIGNLLLMVLILAPSQGSRLYRTRRPGLVLVRALALVVASLFFGYAIQRMPVAETTALIFLGPLLVVLVARPVLGETIGLWGWAAALGGFAGVLLIVRPGSGLDAIGVGLVLMAVAMMVVYYLLSRILAPTESTTAMLFYSAVAGSIAFGVFLPWSIGNTVPSLLDAALFATLGVYGGLGHFMFTAAFQHAPASVLAPVNYLQLVWAGLLGWLTFGHVPDAVTILGMGVVAASGIISAWRSSRPQG